MIATVHMKINFRFGDSFSIVRLSVLAGMTPL
jgi:hypothetical protein